MNMKAMTAIFSLAVVGILICFGMTIYTAVQKNKEKAQPAPISIPTPAIPQ